MKRTELKINTKTKKYSVIVGSNILKNFNKICSKKKIIFEKSLIIIDKNVPNLLKKKLVNNLKSKKKILYIFNANEKNKNFKSIRTIHQLLFKNKFNREDCIISFGGGITGDVAGFASSTFKRGLKFINIPTTLLAQVDSSIGGKTGINNEYGKNQIGSFYQPDLVISDTDLLYSLPFREIICGYAEILKSSLIDSKKSFEYLDKNLKSILKLKNSIIQKAIINSCNLKKKIIIKDEKEENLRKVLNLGHTFAHAYEATLEYSKKLNHGEAVILGIKNAIRYSKQTKLLSKKNYNLINNHLDKIKIKHKFDQIFNVKDLNRILKFMKLDKKNKSEKVNLILIKSFGQIETNYQTNCNNIKKFLYQEFN
tara:strand:+ start:2117 stop:3220 length:1104 start_codon:yes stop_codon:yes gene_type:complete